MIDKLYRYERQNYPDGRVKVFLLSIPIIKETPKGYWINNAYRKRWVSKTGKKRYAYPTQADAIVNYRKRTGFYIRILESQLHSAKLSLKDEILNG
jgi:hypothetical protein